MRDPVDEDGVTEHYYKVLRTCVYTIVSIIVISGNMFVLVVLPKVRFHSTNVTKMYLYSLTIADFSTGIFLCIPMTVSSAVDEWVFGDFWCSVSAFLKVFLSIAGLLSLLTVTVDRFLDIVYPLRYPIIMNRKKGAFVLTCLWITASFFTFLYGPILDRPAIYTTQSLICTFVSSDPDRVDLTILLCLSTFVLLPFIITTALYSKIYCVVKKHAEFETRSDGNRTRGNVKFLKTFILVVLCFGLAWIPSVVIRFIEQLSDIVFPTQVLMLAEILVLWNSGVNVFIYFWRNRDFRKAAKMKCLILKCNDRSLL